MVKYKLSKKEKKLAAIAVSLALAALIFDFAIEPFWKNYHKLNQEINANLLSFRQNQKLLKAYSRLEKEYAVYSRYFEAVKPELSVSQVLKEIEQVSRENSCQIVNIKPFELRDLGSYQEVVVDITLEATASNFSRFLHQIENLTNPLRVKNFSLSPRSDIPGEIKANLRAKKIIFAVK